MSGRIVHHGPLLGHEMLGAALVVVTRFRHSLAHESSGMELATAGCDGMLERWLRQLREWSASDGTDSHDYHRG